jgi:hypothetical protein
LARSATSQAPWAMETRLGSSDMPLMAITMASSSSACETVCPGREVAKACASAISFGAVDLTARAARQRGIATSRSPSANFATHCRRSAWSNRGAATSTLA